MKKLFIHNRLTEFAEKHDLLYNTVASLDFGKTIPRRPMLFSIW